MYGSAEDHYRETRGKEMPEGLTDDQKALWHALDVFGFDFHLSWTQEDLDAIERVTGDKFVAKEG